MINNYSMTEYNTVRTMMEISKLITVYHSNEDDIKDYTEINNVSNHNPIPINSVIYLWKKENKEIKDKINQLLGIR